MVGLITPHLKEALAKDRELKIIFTGRKTGKSYDATLWFINEGNRIYLLPVSGSDTNWYRNVKKNPSMNVLISGISINVSAKPIIEQRNVKEVIEKFGVKYGKGEISKWYTKLDAAVELALPS